MKQRYNDFTHELIWRAVDCCFDGKWTRTEILTFVEEYAGISRLEIFEGSLVDDVNAKIEAVDASACMVENMIEEICSGRIPEEVAPVTTVEILDGMTLKVRTIANLCIPHQLLGHAVKMALDPLFAARILPTQHASIPGRGQTQLKRQIGRYLRRHGLGINYFAKTDESNAYGSTMYADVIAVLKKEIPSARQLIAVMEYLGTIAPGGHLIIGGYLDAWLFNFMASYAIRYLLAQGSTRKGIFRPFVVRVISYMDDFCLLGRTRSGLRKAIAALTKWLDTMHGIRLKQTTSIIKLCSIEEERDRKKEVKPSRRGCPGVDMGGYVIHRTYTTIRPRVVKRIFRTFSRAWREMCKTGTIRKKRAQALIARYGPIRQSDSFSLMVKYHIEEIMQTAIRVCSYWSRQRERKRKENLRNAVHRYRLSLEA